MHKNWKWLAALALFASVQTAAAEDDCRLTALASFAMAPDLNDQIAIPVTIDDRQLLLSLSTGSPRSGLDSSVVDELGLQRTQAAFIGRHGNVRTAGLWRGREYITLNGDRLDQIAFVPSLELGGMRGKNFRFNVFPNGDSHRAVAGVLGADILAQYDVELDFAAGKVKLFSRDHCSGKVVYWTHEPYSSERFHLDQGLHILIPVELDGVRLMATIGTGVPYPLMKLETARSLFGWHSDPAELKPDPGHKGDFDYPFKTLRFAGATVRDPVVKLADEDLHMKADMILGLSALKAFHVYLSYEEETMYLTARDAH